MSKIDDRDIAILTAAIEAATTSTDTLSETTGIPQSTVHYRIDKMRERGIISNTGFDIDLEQVGLAFTIITEVRAEFDTHYHDRVGEQLSEIDGVEQVYFMMGDVDFVVIARLPTQKHAERLVKEYERISEIQRTSSKFVIATIKNDGGVITDYDTENLVEQDGN